MDKLEDIPARAYRLDSNHCHKVMYAIFGLFSLLLIANSALAKYSGGTGDPNTPYQIGTKADLLALAADTGDYGKCFIVTADINMEGQVFTTAIVAPGGVNAFTGMFDGSGHKIIYYTINGESNFYIGLFGYIGSGGSVKNLGLEDCSVSGNGLVGGLVGDNRDSISNCYSTGSVSGSSDSSNVGGLVGRNWYGSISDCYSTGAVSSSSGSSCVGGLMGSNGYGTISQCYSTGSVSGTWEVGGLVGENGDSISNCYSTGAVGGFKYVGGLVGYNNFGSISNCYSTGSVSGSSYVGGMAGINYSGSISSSFWDEDASGQTTSDGGTGKTTVEMKTLSTFTAASWDFVEIWDIGENQTYPYLRVYPAGDLNHNGIVNMADFAIFADHWLEGTAP